MVVFRESKGVVSRPGQAGRPDGTYEDQYSRQGFAGDQAMLYRRHPATAWNRIEGDFGNTVADTFAMDLPDARDDRALPAKMMYNADVAVYVSRRSTPMPFHYRDVDGDELIFVERGAGEIETDFGPLEFVEGDYVVVPKGVTYRLIPQTRDNMFYIIQTTGRSDFPNATFTAPGALICTFFSPQGSHHGPDANPFSAPERPGRFTAYLLNIDVERPLSLTPEYRSYAQDQQELARTTASQR